MKKLFTLLVISLLTFMYASSQESTFLKNSKVINLGIGFGSTYYVGSYYSTGVPPISGSFEIGVVDNIIEKGVLGVGGYLGYSSYKYEYFGWGFKYNNLLIGPRGVFHYPFVDKLDTYTGLIIGARIVSSKEFGTTIPGYDYSASSSGVVGAWFVGARYYFTDKFAAMAELGYGISYLTLGVSLKLE